MALPACGGGSRSPVQVRYTSYICTNSTRATCLPIPEPVADEAVVAAPTCSYGGVSLS